MSDCKHFLEVVQPTFFNFFLPESNILSLKMKSSNLSSSFLFQEKIMLKTH